MLTGDRTTLTEGLDGSGSGCHAMFASPDAFLYRCPGGITVDRTAPAQVTVSPYCPEDLSFVRCSQHIAEGEISVCWERRGSDVVFDISVPPGVRSKLELKVTDERYEEELSGGHRKVTLRRGIRKGVNNGSDN